jgi:hypothetical protein
MKALKRWSLTRRIISAWRRYMDSALQTRDEKHAEMLKARWHDLLYAIDADKLTYDEAMEMYEKLRDTPMIPRREQWT